MITQEFGTGKFILNFALLYRRKLHGQKFVFSKVISLNFRKLKRSSIFILLVLEESVLFSCLYRKMMEFRKTDISKKIFILKIILFAFTVNFLYAGNYEWSGTVSDDTNIAAPSTIILTADAEFTGEVKLYKKDWITIDLQGHNLTINKLHIGNDSTETGWVSFIDSTGGGSVEIDTLSSTTYALDKKKLEIDSGVTVSVNNQWNSGNNIFNGGIQLSGSGTFNINCSIDDTSKISVDSSNTPVISGTNTAAITSITGAPPSTDYTWTGTTNSDWENSGNWLDGIIPPSGTDYPIYIPKECIHYPQTSTPLAIDTLIIETGAEFSSDSPIEITNLNAGGEINFNRDAQIGTLNLIGDLTINSSGDITVTGDIEDQDSDDSLTILCSNFYAGGSIGQTSSIKDISITGHFEGTSGSEHPVTISGNLTIDGNDACLRGDIEAGSIEIKQPCSILGATNAITTTGTQSYKGFKINSDSGLLTLTGTTVTLDGNITPHESATSSKSLKVSGDAVLKGTITTTGTQTYTEAVALSGDTTILTDSNSVTFGDTITGGTHDLIIGSASDSTESTFNGNITAVSTLNLYGNSTLGANINVAVWNNPNDKTIIPGTSTVTVSSKVNGSNTFNNLTISSTTGSVQFEAGKTQTVTGTFTAEGSSGSEVSLLSSTPGTQWKLNAATPAISYAKIKDANNISGTPIAPSNSINLGNNTGFDLPSKFRWSATAASSDVATLSNWELNTEGATWITATSLPGQNSTDDEVEIQASTNNPDFASATDIICKKLTIDSDAELTLSSTGNIQVKNGSFTNEGKIIYTDSGRIKNNAATPVAIMDAENGTVEFAGTSLTIDDINTSGDDYNNLILSGTLTLGNNIQTKGSIKLKDDTTLQGSGLTLTAGAAIDSFTADAKSLTLGSSGNAVNLVFKNIGTTNKLNNITSYGSFTCSAGQVKISGELNCQSNAILRGNVEAGSINAAGLMTFGHATRTVTTTGNQVYTNKIDINSEDATETLTLKTGTSGSIEFQKEINAYLTASTPSQTAQLIIESPSVTFTEDIGTTYKLKSVSVTGNTVLTTDRTFITIDAVTFDGTITGPAGGCNLTIGNTSVNSKAEFTSNASFTNINELTVYGTTINAGTISTADKQTYTGAVTNTGNIKVPSLASNTDAIEFKGGLSGNGAITGASTSASDTEPNPNIVFSGGSVTLGTFTPNDDKIKFTGTCSFNSNSITIPDVEFGAASGTVTLSAPLTANELTLSSGTLSHAGTNTITTDNWSRTAGTLSSASTVKVKGDISGTTTFNILEILDDTDHTTNITANNTITELKCSVPSKNIVFTAGTEQTITKLTLNGGTSNTLINLKSSSTDTAWNIKNTTGTNSINFISVQDSHSDTEISASKSVVLSNNIKWIVNSTYYWKESAASSDWKTLSNWTYKCDNEEFTIVSYPGQYTDFDTVIIAPSEASHTNLPVYNETSDITLKQLINGSTTDSTTTLTFTNSGSIKLSDSTSPIKNYGKIIYKTAGRLKNNPVSPATPSPVTDTAQGTVEFDGPSSIDDINATGDDYYNLIITQTVTLGDAIQAAGNITVNAPITGGTSLTVRSGGSSYIGANITTSGNQTYNGTNILTADITFTSSTGSISFNKTKDYYAANSSQTKTKLTVTTTSGAITFNGDTTVDKLTITNPSSLAIKPATIESRTGFTLTGAGTVSLGTSDATAQTTIKTTDSAINFSGTGNVTTLSPVTLNSTGTGDITLSNPFEGSASTTQSLTLSSGTGKIFLNNTIGNTTPIGSLTATGLTQINATVKTNNKPITFNSTTYLACKNTADANTTTLSSGTSVITVANSSDLYISALKADNNAKNITITADTLSVSGNIALFNGNVTLNANMTSGKDIILLNGNVSTMYKLESETNHIAYINSMRTSANKLKEPSLTTFPTTMPDATTTIGHTVYKSSLSGFNGKTIKAGQNFYDNGVNLSPSAGWTLSLKANNDATVSFAEAYNAHIGFCTVTAHDETFAWLSAGEGCTNDGNNSTDSTDQIDYGTDNGTGAVTCHPTGIAFLHPVFLVADTTKSAAEGRTTGPEIPNLSGTYAVRDNVIRIEFVRNNYTTGRDQKSATALIENSNNEISAAASRFKFNDGQTAFIGTYIDAECTVSTDGKGDLAVFYIKANSKWNLDASGTAVGTTPDTDGVLHTDVYNDIEFTKVISGVFASLYDNHKNRIADYSQTPYARPTPDSREGHRFTAVISRYVIDAMHISFTVADFTTKKLYIYFNDALDNDNITWGGSPIATEDSIKFYSDTTTQAPSITIENIELNALNDHGIVLTLNNLDYSMIQYGIKIEYSSSYFLNNKIHGKHNLVVNNGESHCITDVITNCVEVQYAYDNRNDTYIDSTGGLAPEDSIVMRDFTGTGKHNKVFADKNITLVTKDIAPEDSAGNPADFKYKLVADITPSANCDGTTYEEISGHKTRFWFAEGTTAIDGFSPVLNSSTNKRNSVSNSDLITQTINTDNIVYYFHNFSEESPCLNWQSGSDVRFLFEVLDGTGQPITINHSFDGTTYEDGTKRSPLYCARLINPLDPTSIDLWSFKISEPNRQRGGVSIYSNVINAVNKDFCTLEVNMPKDGNLRVIVMTADGNIVKYLENGRQSTGLHYYYWNGTNNAGDTVARGIYFVRVVGPEIEETRKVMVVK